MHASGALRNGRQVVRDLVQEPGLTQGGHHGLKISRVVEQVPVHIETDNMRDRVQGGIVAQALEAVTEYGGGDVQIVGPAQAHRAVLQTAGRAVLPTKGQAKGQAAVTHGQVGVGVGVGTFGIAHGRDIRTRIDLGRVHGPGITAAATLALIADDIGCTQGGSVQVKGLETGTGPTALAKIAVLRQAHVITGIGIGNDLVLFRLGIAVELRFCAGPVVTVHVIDPVICRGFVAHLDESARRHGLGVLELAYDLFLVGMGMVGHRAEHGIAFIRVFFGGQTQVTQRNGQVGRVVVTGNTQHVVIDHMKVAIAQTEACGYLTHATGLGQPGQTDQAIGFAQDLFGGVGFVAAVLLQGVSVLGQDLLAGIAPAVDHGIEAAGLDRDRYSAVKGATVIGVIHGQAEVIGRTRGAGRARGLKIAVQDKLGLVGAVEVQAEAPTVDIGRQEGLINPAVLDAQGSTV